MKDISMQMGKGLLFCLEYVGPLEVVDFYNKG